MPKIYKAGMIAVVVLLALVIYMDATAPEPLDWHSSYYTEDKIPLGTFVFYDMMKHNFPEMVTIENAPFEVLKDTSMTGTYIFVNQAVHPGKTAMEEMLNWVEKGNTLFVSALYSQFFDSDSLGVKSSTKFESQRADNFQEYYFVNPDLKSRTPYSFKHDDGLRYFSKIDTLEYTVLGKSRINTGYKASEDEINFIEIPVGKGRFLMHLAPQAFSNYFLLTENNIEYAEKILSYLNTDGNIYYDTYFFPERTGWETSPLYVLFNNRYLKWAYYFVIIGAFLFILFEGKRKQKAIRIIPPETNRSYEYTRTISGMYLDRKDHTSIAHKQIDQFLDFIRKKFRLDVLVIDKELIQNLKEMTGNSAEDIRSLFDYIRNLQGSTHVTKGELISLNEKINSFKENI